MRRAADVHHVLRAAESVDRLGDEALRPGFARALDLRVAVAAGALGFLQDAGIGFRQRLVGEQRAGLRHLAVRQIDRGRGRPVRAEQFLDGLDGGGGALDQRIAVAGVGDGGLQHVAQPHRAVVAQQQHPGFEGAGHAGRRAARCRAPCRGPRSRNARWWRLAGAGPWPQITSVRPRLTSWTMIGTSPPGPFRCGSTTCSVKAVATPASKALPPFSRMPMPTAVAIQCVEVTTPKVPSISGRVVKGSGLMLLMGFHAAAGICDAAHLTTGEAGCQPLGCHAWHRVPVIRPAPRRRTGSLTAWQATPSISAGASLRHRSNASGQRGLKAQPGGGSIGLGISPLHRNALAAGHREIGNRTQQHPGVGHARIGEQFAAFGDLDDAAEIHHADAARHVADHGEVVADEQIGQAELVLQVAHQIEDLRLHGDVERRGRLVADDEFGFRRQRAGDRDALALAAGKFVRIFHAVVGMQPDQRQQLADPRRGYRARPGSGRRRGSARR